MLSQDTTVKPALKTLFVHAPKCGGTTAWVYLGGMYPPDRCLYAVGRGFVDGSISVDDLYGLAYEDVRNRADFITGHFDHAALSGWSRGDIFEDYAAVTILRDPMSRLRSSFSYGWKYPELVGSTYYRETTFADHVRHLVSTPAEQNDLSRFLTGQVDTNAALAVLQRDYAVAVPIEDLADFLDAYQARVGGGRADPQMVLNETGPACPTWETVDAELIEAFKAASAADHALWTHAGKTWRQSMGALMDRPRAALK